MRAIVNLSTLKYKKGQERLIQTLEGKSNADLLMFMGEKSVGAPLHTDNNYAFKVYAIEMARNSGYTSVLWLDASMYVIRDLEPIFKIIEKDGYFFQDSGWTNERWTNKRTTDYFGTNAGKQFSSGVLGLDFTNAIAVTFFELWKQAMLDGQFHGSHTDHRHDQAAGSIIAHQMKLKIRKEGSVFIYQNPQVPSVNTNELIYANGII